MNLSVFSAPVYLGFLYILVFPVGYLLLDLKAFKKFHALPFSVRFPIYLAFGLISSSVIYYFVGLVMVDALVPIITFLFSLLLVLLKKRTESHRLTKIVFYKSHLLSAFIPIILFLLSFIYFGYTVGYFRWPTPSADALNYGLFTSLNIYYGKMTDVFGGASFNYPWGFPITAANFSLALNLYPGEAIFILAAAVIALIPPILYSLTYINTGSKVFSLLAFLSPFLIHSNRSLERWLVGYFFNGLYSNIAGYLAVFTFCTFISLEDNSRKVLPNPTYLLLTIPIGIFLVTTYPSFLIFILLYLTFAFSVNARLIVTWFLAFSTPKKSLISGLLLLILMGLTLNFQKLPFVGTFFSFIRNPQDVWRVPIDFLYDWRFGHLIFIGAAIAIFLIVVRSNLGINTFYLIVFIPVILSLDGRFFPYASPLLPIRCILMLTCLSWALLSILLDLLLNKSLARKGTPFLRLAGKKIKLRYLTDFFVLALAVSLFGPTLYSHLSMEQASYAGWFSNREGFTSDFAALEWIDENIPPNDLILNDLSFTSLYLSSFSIRNLTIYPYASLLPPFSDRGGDSYEVWANPDDPAILKRVIEKHDIKYILVTSEQKFWDFLVMRTYKYTDKFYTPREYRQFFDNYPFLTIVFSSGDSLVYRISG